MYLKRLQQCSTEFHGGVLAWNVRHLKVSIGRSTEFAVMIIWFPLHNVRSKCECAHTMRVGMILVVRLHMH